MTQDVVERLRAVESSGDPARGIGRVTTNWYRNPDGPEAAALITDLRAKLERARAGLEACLARETERAKIYGYSDCCCMMLSRDGEREYETGTCPHQRARAILAEIERGEGE